MVLFSLKFVLLSVLYSLGNALVISPKIGISFSPSGLLTPFHLGAKEQLKTYGFINERTALAGSSGGALTALSAGLDLSSETLLVSTANIAKRCRDEGARNVLRQALEAEFENALPVNCCETLSSRKAPCFVAYTEWLGFRSKPSYVPHYVSDFKDRDDVIALLSASCNVPYIFDHNNAFVNVRGTNGMDGFFSTGLDRLGCPPTTATDLEISVSPYSGTKTFFNPRYSAPKDNTCEYVLITPHLLDKQDWPFTLSDVIKLSFDAPKSKLDKKKPISDAEIDSVYYIMYKAGMTAVSVWYKQLSNKNLVKLRSMRENM